MGRARAFEGISQEAMAAIVGCSQAYLSKLENGEVEPTIKLVHLYAKETGNRDLLWRAFEPDIRDLLDITNKAVRYEAAQQLMQA